MPKLRFALNSADAPTLRALAHWFRKQAQSCDTLADAAEWERRQSARTAEQVNACRAERYAEAAALGAPAAMIASWQNVNANRRRRQQLEQRTAKLRALLAANVPQRRIARQLGLSLGRVNSLAQEARQWSTKETATSKPNGCAAPPLAPQARSAKRSGAASPLPPPPSLPSS